MEKGPLPHCRFPDIYKMLMSANSQQESGVYVYAYPESALRGPVAVADSSPAKPERGLFRSLLRILFAAPKESPEYSKEPVYVYAYPESMFDSPAKTKTVGQ